MTEHNDDLRAARGFCNAFMLASIPWAVILGIVYLVQRMM
jgi:hypothetical protein